MPRMNEVEVQVNVKFDVNDLAQMLDNEQLKAVMLGIGQVLAATRKHKPAALAAPADGENENEN